MLPVDKQAFPAASRESGKKRTASWQEADQSGERNALGQLRPPAGPEPGRAFPGPGGLARPDVQDPRAGQRRRIPRPDRDSVAVVLPVEIEEQQLPGPGMAMSSGTAATAAQSTAATNDSGP
jgi:hypothetical protein